MRYIFALMLLLVCSFASADQTVTDADGNVYPTVRIGDQIWMAENLRTTRYQDGTPISEFQFGMNWNEGDFTVPLYQWSDTSDSNNHYDEELPVDFYGAIYNEAAISSGNLIPAGWRLPSLADVSQLEQAIAEDGFAGTEGTALKATDDWFDGDPGTDIYGFNALPGGYVTNFGGTAGVLLLAVWATSQADAHDVAGAQRTTFNLVAFGERFFVLEQPILLGSTIRFVRDVAGTVPGDVNCDGIVDLLDIQPFVDLLISGGYEVAADLNGDGTVDLLDVQLFVDLLSN